MLGVEFKKKGDVIRDVTILTLKAKSNATLLNQIVGKVNHHVSTGSTANHIIKSINVKTYERSQWQIKNT